MMSDVAIPEVKYFNDPERIKAIHAERAKLSKLDSIQTTLPRSMAATYKEQMGHTNDPEYLMTLECLSKVPSTAKKSPEDRFRDCGRHAWFYRNINSGMVRVGSSRCNLRWCPQCAAGRRARISSVIEDWLKTVQHKKFITLTLKNDSSPLAGQIDLLYTYFQYLRKKKLWKDSVRGGIWFFQVTYNADAGQWHPHLHILAESIHLCKFELSELWLAITKNSMIVDVRNVKGDKKAAEYVARYGSRPAFLSKLGVEKGVEAIVAMHGRRILGKFGTAKALNFKVEPPADANDWKIIGSWWSVRHFWDCSDAAKLIYLAWKTNTSLGPDISLCSNHDPEPEPPAPIPISTYKQFYFKFSEFG